MSDNLAVLTDVGNRSWRTATGQIDDAHRHRLHIATSTVERLMAKGLDVADIQRVYGGVGHTVLGRILAEHGTPPEIGENLQTITVGQVTLGDKVYSWYGMPVDAPNQHKVPFGGTMLTVRRGDLWAVEQDSREPPIQEAIDQTKQVLGAHTKLGVTACRATFDVVQGKAADGEYYSSVVACVGPNASAAAEAHGIAALREIDAIKKVHVYLNYDYADQAGPNPEGQTATVAETDDLRVTASYNGWINKILWMRSEAYDQEVHAPARLKARKNLRPARKPRA